MSPQKSSIIPKTINPDIQKERNGSNFDVEEFAVWWNGGVDQLKIKRELEEYLLTDVEEGNAHHYLSHEDMYTEAIKGAIETAKKLRAFQEKHNRGGNDIWPKMYGTSVSRAVMPLGNPLTVQFLMLIEAIRNQGTDEQFEKFGKRAANFQIAGTYAQTELGHGTYLRGLETRADYDRKTEEFVMNTPKLSSYKWWPGGLGQTCNYCLVVAQLYIDGKSKGVQMFWVQIRDEDTHMPMPGVDVGEIGKKMGFHGVNNGYLGLKNVRIPRMNMLMRNSQVHADGTFVSNPISALTYLPMLYTRCAIVNNSAYYLAICATIATRYAAVRRQSPINPNEKEPQILDHVTQQLKLFPEIASAMAYRLAATKMNDMYSGTYDQILRGEYDGLPELHSLSCAMKVLSSYDATNGIEALRLSCGGHGYLDSANLGPMFASCAASCTYEGENTVLSLQVGRFLIKCWRNMLAGNPLPPSAQYLAEANKKSSFGRWTGTWQNMIAALQYASAAKIRIAFGNLSARLKAGEKEGDASNHTGIELVQAAELHGYSFICSNFLEEVVGPKSKLRSPGVNKIFENTLELYLVNMLLRHMAAILRCIPLTDTELRGLQNRLEDALKAMRPNAVSMCDGFDFHDKTLGSTLGSYDGNVYERIYEVAKLSPLNQKPVPKAFHEHLKPFMKSNL